VTLFWSVSNETGEIDGWINITTNDRTQAHFQDGRCWMQHVRHPHLTNWQVFCLARPYPLEFLHLIVFCLCTHTPFRAVGLVPNFWNCRKNRETTEKAGEVTFFWFTMVYRRRGKGSRKAFTASFLYVILNITAKTVKSPLSSECKGDGSSSHTI
jgi:hypothetical protein